MEIRISSVLPVVAILMIAASGCDDAYYPFITANGTIDIQYELASSGSVTILIENCYLNTVRTLVDSQNQEAGSHTVTWDLMDDEGEFVENGLYTVEVYRDGSRVFVQVVEVDRQ